MLWEIIFYFVLLESAINLQSMCLRILSKNVYFFFVEKTIKMLVNSLKIDLRKCIIYFGWVCYVKAKKYIKLKYLFYFIFYIETSGLFLVENKSHRQAINVTLTNGSINFLQSWWGFLSLVFSIDFLFLKV